MRCLTLANELTLRGARCIFVCGEHVGHLCGHIAAAGHALVRLPVSAGRGAPAMGEGDDAHAEWLGASAAQDAEQTASWLAQSPVDWLIVDHYALAVEWERQIRPWCRQIMVIDDLADRPHDCDLLLDQNLGRHAADYDSRLPDHCERLIGPDYALLRPEFAHLRPTALARRRTGQCHHILVTMGGVDSGNTTAEVLAGLDASGLPDDAVVTVVLGAGAPWQDAVRTQAGQMRLNAQVLVDAGNMAELMCMADLAIGAAGSTSWERCCMGLPSILVVLADNQRRIAEALHRRGAALLAAGAHRSSAIRHGLHAMLGPGALSGMSNCAAALVDGLGAPRVAQTLYSRVS